MRKILAIYYHDGTSENFHSEVLSFDERTNCFQIEEEDNEGNLVVNHIPIRSIKKARITIINEEREL